MASLPALVFVSIVCSLAARTMADEIAVLKDPKQRDLHAGAALALGYAKDSGPAAQTALVKACASRDPVLAACAAHALGHVDSPGAASFHALLELLDYPVTLLEPAGNAKGWGRLNNRAFAYRYVPRGDGGFTNWVVFRTWGKRKVEQSLHVASRRGGPRFPGGAAVPPHGGWVTSTKEVRLEKADPATVQVVGADPATGWRLEGDGIVLVPRRRPILHRASKPGALRDLVVRAATNALGSVIQKGDKALVRRALTHKNAAVRDIALAVLMHARDPAPFAQEIFDIIVLHPKTRFVRRVFRRVGPASGPVLKRAIESDEEVRRSKGVYLTGVMGADAKLAVPAVANLLGKSDVVPLSDVLNALNGVGREAGAATEALRAYVRERREHYELALDTLRSIGPAAKAAVPDLVEIARKRPGFGHGRLRATMALAAIQPGHPELPGFVAACFSDPSDNVVELALLNLAGWSRPSPEVLAALRNASKHKNKHIRDAARRMLGRLEDS